MRVAMTALRPFRYANRALVAGEDFEAKGRTDAKILSGIGKARVREREMPTATEIKFVPADPMKTSVEDTHIPAPAGTTDIDEISQARAEYAEVVGRRPFHGWDVAALREKIAAHKSGAE